jgi:histidinol phosphatase-like PHP family hydrolase
VAAGAGAKLLLNTDAHSPGDLLDPRDAVKFAQGAGVEEKNSKIITSVNPKTFLGSI